MSRRIEAVLKFAAVPNFGPSRARKLFTRLKAEDVELEYLVEYCEADLRELGFTEEQSAQFIEPVSMDKFEVLVDQGLEVVSILDSNAPKRLLNSRSCPWYFYVGRLDILQRRSIAFAGSRDASPDAIELTLSIAASAGVGDWNVVSGGARGVDSASHHAAIESGGVTTIVLPQGIATWRVPESIDIGRALILSEFLPFDEWSGFRAMQRNKSVVELSDVVVIPQSGERGGTWNAGEYSVNRKKLTYVADLGDEYPGNRKLIGLGAKPLSWTGDVDSLKPENGDDEPAQAQLF